VRIRAVLLAAGFLVMSVSALALQPWWGVFPLAVPSIVILGLFRLVGAMGLECPCQALTWREARIASIAHWLLYWMWEGLEGVEWASPRAARLASLLSPPEG
jgi:hypothetical protein